MNKQRLTEKQAEFVDFVREKGYLSEVPPRYSLHLKLKRVIPKYIKGQILDLGAGKMPYKELLKKNSKKYLSLDIKQYKGKIDIVAKAEKTGLENNFFDSVFSSALLEHVPEPEKVLSEVYRILKKKGNLVLIVPHFFILHNEPSDYLRFTEHGLRYLLEKRGFKIVKIISVGGWLSFNSYIFSRILIFIYNIPILFEFCLILLIINNRIVHFFEENIKLFKLMPLTYIAIARK